MIAKCAIRACVETLFPWGAQVTHLLGKPLLRTFDPLRKTVQLSPGWGLNIVPPPQPHRLFVSRTPSTISAVDALTFPGCGFVRKK